ncbi:magnesium-translocating P-type ATPase [Pusillibacter faecalis]|uniref:magnesium-translocating P-type ATPase n=1 Tax=Pusillibacter faecalis TaxID=2714358 RepID=UPI0029436A9F|nr:magnesium-translocating P-type ATPase [Pusillibacter faecalis]
MLEKNTDQLASAAQISLNQFSNTAFMGSTVTSGEGRGIVLAVGCGTVYGGYLSELQRSKHSFDAEANSIAWVLIRFMAALGPIIFVVSGITQGDWLTSFLFSLSVAVGLTPELLPMVVSACLAKGSAAMGKKQTIVKNINAMQSFGSMDVLCVDKTGTLTGDEVILEYYLDILGAESAEVLDCAYLNSFYHTGAANHLDRAILKCSGMPGRETHFSSLGKTVTKLDELSFDYAHKCVSVLLSDPEKGSYMITKGDVDSVFFRCQYVQHKGEIVKIDAADVGGVHAVVDEMTEDGMKVLAVAYKLMPGHSRIQPEDEAGLILLGYVVFFDAPKSSAASALQKLEQLHVRVKVLTGDQKSVTLSICRRLGIETEHILTGEELEELSEDEQLLSVERTTVFAQLTPGQKSQIIRMLRENGHAVGFLGDGMNDLAAMTAANVGISVDTAVQAAKESADVILLKKDLNVLEQGILEGRKAFANMSKYIRITASSNFGNIFSIVLTSAFLPFLPMTALQLLLLNLLYDILCMTLPWDRVDVDAYERPSEWSGETLGRFMRFFGPLSSLFDLATFAFLYFVLCPILLGGGFSELDPAMQEQFAVLFHTGWFLESMWTQVLILHLLRTKQLSLVKSRASGIVWLVTSAGLFILTAIVYTPVARLLGLVPLPLWYFGFLAGIILAYMLLVTAAKRWYIRKYHTLS